MKVRKNISEPIDIERDGVRVVGGINAVVNANINEPGTSVSSSRQKIRIKMRGGKSTVAQEEVDSTGD